MESINNDSFREHLLDHPHYTKPNEIDGFSVPDILLSGNQYEIKFGEENNHLGVLISRDPIC